jgi:tRNA A37 methylthiotransferase MiaB
MRIRRLSGETEADHDSTATFLATLPLRYANVYPYSRRPGTRAAAMAGQLPREVKAARAAALREIAQGQAERFLATLAASGETVTVALERLAPAAGTTGHYVDCRFTAEPEASLGALVRATSSGRDGDLLLVRPQNKACAP